MVDPTGESPTDDINRMLWWVFNAEYTDVMSDLRSEWRSYQQGVTALAQSLPWTGDIWDIYALATGKDLYTGKNIEWLDRWIAAGAAFIPGVNGGEVRGSISSMKTIKQFFSLDAKIINQMGKRGWTESKIANALESRNTAQAIDKSTGQKATAYFIGHNQYVVKNDQTWKIIQISNLNDKEWKIDKTISPITKSK